MEKQRKISCLFVGLNGPDFSVTWHSPRKWFVHVHVTRRLFVTWLMPIGWSFDVACAELGEEKARDSSIFEA